MPKCLDLAEEVEMAHQSVAPLVRETYRRHSAPYSADCLVQFIDRDEMLIEGAAAVAIEVLLEEQNQPANKNVVVVLCGPNVVVKRLSSIPAGEPS